VAEAVAGPVVEDAQAMEETTTDVEEISILVSSAN
jgi:hypothetical protein